MELGVLNQNAFAFALSKSIREPEQDKGQAPEGDWDVECRCLPAAQPCLAVTA